MNVAVSNTPAMTDAAAKQELQPAQSTAAGSTDGTADTGGSAADEEEKAASNSPLPPVKKKLDGPEPELDPENVDDEEVQLAMEMAIAAAQNPHLSPEELRKLVGEKNKQLEIVSEVEKVKQKEEQEKQEKERQEAKERWENQKENAWKWWAQKKEAVGQRAEELKWEAEKQFYAEDIKKDKEIMAIRKKMKVAKKTLKAHRLQGNRVETRHAFKRRRMEKSLHDLNKRLQKTQHQLTNTSFGVQEYAKAMMRASKKWRKKGTKQELALEAQLCRNMHQMLAIEKQRAKLKKTSREIKKYLQRCKSWLSDKKAFCEMHIITLDATASSMKFLYEDTLARQDKLIRKLMAQEEFQGVDLADVELPHLDYSIEQAPGPSAMLNALRGLPIRDSIRISKDQINTAALEAEQAPAHQQHGGSGGRHELHIEAKDDISVSSDLSDPDGDFDEEHPEPTQEELEADSDSEGGFDFGNDAPWNSAANNSGELSAESPEEDAKPAAKKDAPAPAAKAADSAEIASVAESTLDGAALIGNGQDSVEDIAEGKSKDNLQYSTDTNLYVSDASASEGGDEAKEEQE